MKCPEEWPRLSLHGMRRSPHKPPKRWSIRSGGLIEPHPVQGSGDSGNKPAGKLSKGKRVCQEPPGRPRGRCIKDASACSCGKHYKVNR